MTFSWHNLYLFYADSQPVAEALRHSLDALNYESFDPFGLFPVRAYAQAVRLFVAPSQNGWVRVIGTPDQQQLPALSRLGLCLSAGIQEGQAHIAVYQDSQAVPPENALVPHLRAGKTPADLLHALTAPISGITSPAYTADTLPMEVLPESVKTMAKGMNQKQANKMFSRLSKQLLKSSGVDDKEARKLLAANTVDWNSAAGKRLGAVLSCLTLPERWRFPDFVTLRDAYQLQKRRQQNPNARLYPGDAEALDKVPDALDYIPVYAGLRS